MNREKEIRAYVRKLIVEELRCVKKLRVFDFDDTLVKTRSLIHVVDAEGESFDLTPDEFAIYEKVPGDVFDFTDFEKLIEPREIKWTLKILKNIISKGGEVVILTARGSARPVKQFLSDSNLPDLQVIALGSGDPALKAKYIAERLKEDSICEVEFFDDSLKNIMAVKNLQQRFPDVKIIVRHIVHKIEAA